MKIRWKPVLLAAAAMVAAGIAGLLFLYQQGAISDRTVPINLEKTMNASNLQAFSITTDTPDLTVIKSKTDELKVSVTGEVHESYESRINLELTPDGSGTDAVAEVKTEKHFTVGIDLNQLFALFHNRLKVTVELPDRAYRALKVKSDTGDISITQISADTLEIRTDTGDVTLDGFTGNRLTGSSDTGTLRLAKVSSAVSLSSDTGDFQLDLASLAGDVNLSTDTGDMDVTLSKPAPLSVDFASDTGKTTASTQDGTFNMETKEKHRLVGTLNGGGARIKARSDTGDIRLNVK